MMVTLLAWIDTQVRVLEQSHQVGLASLLQGHHGRALEPEVGLEILGNLPHEALEWQLTDKQLGGLLVSPNFPEGHRARPVPVRFLHSSCCWGRLTSSLGGELLPGGFSSSRFARSLLSTSHFPLVVSVKSCCSIKLALQLQASDSPC